jgi:hypothetical protein
LLGEIGEQRHVLRKREFDLVQGRFELVEVEVFELRSSSIP